MTDDHLLFQGTSDNKQASQSAASARKGAAPTATPAAAATTGKGKVENFAKAGSGPTQAKAPAPTINATTAKAGPIETLPSFKGAAQHLCTSALQPT